MLTPFGKAIRKLRIDHDMKLSKMAELLNVSPTFLTAIEMGRKPIPANLPQRVASHFIATEQAVFKCLHEAAEQSKSVYKITVGTGARDQHREIAALFARRFSKLTEEQIKHLRPILETAEGE